MSGFPHDDFSGMWYGFDEPPRWQRRNPWELPPAELAPPQNAHPFPDMGFSNTFPARPLLQASRLPEFQAPDWTFYDGYNNEFANGGMRGQPQHGNPWVTNYHGYDRWNDNDEASKPFARDAHDGNSNEFANGGMRGQPQHGNPWAMNHHGDPWAAMNHYGYDGWNDNAEASNPFAEDVQDFMRHSSADARATFSSEVYQGTGMTSFWGQADARGNASQGRGFRHPPQRVVEADSRYPPPVQVQTIATSQTKRGGNDGRTPEVNRAHATRSRRSRRRRQPGPYLGPDDEIYQGTPNRKRKRESQANTSEAKVKPKRWRYYVEPLPPATSYRWRSTLSYDEVYEEKAELAQPHNLHPPGQTDNSTSSQELQSMDETTTPDDNIQQ